MVFIFRAAAITLFLLLGCSPSRWSIISWPRVRLQLWRSSMPSFSAIFQQPSMIFLCSLASVGKVMFFSWTVVSMSTSFSLLLSFQRDLCGVLTISRLHQSQDACRSARTRWDQMVSQIENRSRRKSAACMGSLSTGQQIIHPIIRTSALEACCPPSCGQVPPDDAYQKSKVQNPFLLISSQFAEPILLIHASYLSHSPMEFWKHSMRILVSFAFHFASFLTSLRKSLQSGKH